MNTSNEQLAYDMARQTKEKRDEILLHNIPYPCKKCGEMKEPAAFVKHYTENIIGTYQYLYECKDCKKARIYNKRSDDRQDLPKALTILFTQCKQNAKQRNIAFELPNGYFAELRTKQAGRCRYTGYAMHYEYMHYKKGNFSEKIRYQVSCDRIDNTIGYTKENVVLCCTIANTMKGTLTEDEFYQICSDIIKEHR